MTPRRRRWLKHWRSCGIPGRRCGQGRVPRSHADSGSRPRRRGDDGAGNFDPRGRGQSDAAECGVRALPLSDTLCHVTALSGDPWGTIPGSGADSGAVHGHRGGWRAGGRRVRGRSAPGRHRDGAIILRGAQKGSGRNGGQAWRRRRSVGKTASCCRTLVRGSRQVACTGRAWQ